MKVIKRDGKKVEFDSNKIVVAISKANREVIGNEKASIQNINYIVEAIEKLNVDEIGIEKIQDQIERKLMELRKI